MFTDSCSWDGIPCDLVTDFTARLSEHGLCYTFNHEVNNPRISHLPGKQHGIGPFHKLLVSRIVHVLNTLSPGHKFYEWSI